MREDIEETNCLYLLDAEVNGVDGGGGSWDSESDENEASFR